MISNRRAMNSIAGGGTGFFILILLTGCGSGRASFSASKKYAPEELQKDYQVYRSLLETHHPGLYWYTAKDSMDYFLDWGSRQLRDSLNHSSGKFSVM